MKPDGKISGEITGEYSIVDNSNFITIITDETTYHGIMVRMCDEAGNDTFCISAVGENNHSIWAVQYLTATEE